MNRLTIFDPALEKIFNDPSVEDILLKPRGLAYYKNHTWFGPSMCLDCSSDKIWRIARDLAEISSLTLSLTLPVVDAICEIGSGHCFRAHVTIEPFVEEGPEICFRRIQRQQQFQLPSFFDRPTDAAFVRDAFLAGKSFLIGGATGAGKSTFLSCLLSELPKSTRVLLLEDTKELPLPNDLSTRLLTRTNRFGFREGARWILSDLLRESLRMRPERLILGECRGSEAKIIFDALATGHRGLATTIHAGCARNALERFNSLSEFDPTHREKNPWDFILMINIVDGNRRVTEIQSREEGKSFELSTIHH